MWMIEQEGEKNTKKYLVFEMVYLVFGWGIEKVCLHKYKFRLKYGDKYRFKHADRMRI